jgi:FkbM family methyltransferase
VSVKLAGVFEGRCAGLAPEATTVNQIDSEAPYGTYAVDDRTRLLRMLVGLGLSRGKLTKWIRQRWLDEHGPLVDAEVQGTHYRFDLRDNVTDSKVLLSSKVYDGEEIAALAETVRGGVFIDVGANIGYYTLALLRHGAERAVAIEPNPPALQRLRFNIAINGLEEQVSLVEEGVGPEGELEFFQTSALGGASFVRPDEAAPTIRVRTRPLLSILDGLGITSIGALKIDVEGFEDRVLLPFLQQAPSVLLPRTVVMERCNADCWQQDPVALFMHSGYRILRETRGNLILRRNETGR